VFAQYLQILSYPNSCHHSTTSPEGAALMHADKGTDGGTDQLSFWYQSNRRERFLWRFHVAGNKKVA